VKRTALHVFCLLAAVMGVCLLRCGICSAAEVAETGFEIRDFEMTGNTIFPMEKLRDAVAPYRGTGKTAADVEKARDALEGLYHEAGYPAVIVNIPEQTLKEGIVKLEVIESRIGRVRVTGNRYFTEEKISRGLPSLRPGEILYLPKVQEEVNRLNRNPDFKVNPSMAPGVAPGTIDIELKVEDRLPLHGYLELSNRASPDTTELRLNAMVRYDNLWQREHSAAIQYQTSPQKTEEVQVIGASYVLPAPWEQDHQLAFYAIWSDSDTAFGEGFRTIGKGEIFGLRYVMPLQPYKLYAHNITLGIDYKHFDQTVGFTTGSGETTETPISYLPFSVSYSASLPDEGGTTQFSAGLNMSFRGVVSDEREFELKRYKAHADYLFATAGVQRAQKLPWGMSLFVKVDGQMSDQPLIDNEQYVAGGMESVRGYKESEVTGDNAVHGTIELTFPDPLDKTPAGKKFQMSPFLFYDAAKLVIRDPLPGQDDSITIQGAGVGMRGSILRNIEYEVDGAVAMNSTDNTESGDLRFYFMVKTVF
jgi:hemolysin activation/secretion protein